MLCDVCLHVLSDALRLDFNRGRDKHLPVTHQSTQSEAERLQCYVCGRGEHFRLDRMIIRVRKPESLTGHLDIFTTKRDLVLECCHGTLNAISADEIELAERSRSSASTGSDASLALAAIWMRKCLSNHLTCEGRRNPRWYPRRLLDVSGSRVRLVDTSRSAMSGPYTTLSHCWGGAEAFILTAENIAAFEQGVPRSEFFQTFQDAIEVTARLHISYIWIDCFCIVQHSVSGSHVQEKLADLALMAEVYTNSILNIGAAHGRTPKEGCFVERSSLGLNVPEYFFPLTRDGEESPYLHRVYNPKSSTSDASEIDSQPLFRRGWVVQERLLCPRMLHFGKQQLHWECNEFLGSEAYPSGYNSQYPNPKAAFHSALRESHSAMHSGLWKGVVQNYSKMDLSRPTEDKLVAIGGIAKLCDERMNGKYIAGLFLSDDFLAQLLWRPFSNSPSTSKEWRAPSWSWSSSDRPIIHYDVQPSYQPLIVLQHTNVELTSPANLYGSLQSASLELRCPIIPITFGMTAGAKSGPTRIAGKNTFGDVDKMDPFDWFNPFDSRGCQTIAIFFHAHLSVESGHPPVDDPHLDVQVDDDGDCKRDLLNGRDFPRTLQWYLLPVLLENARPHERLAPVSKRSGLRLEIPLAPRMACLVIEKVSPHTFIRRGIVDVVQDQQVEWILTVRQELMKQFQEPIILV